MSATRFHWLWLINWVHCLPQSPEKSNLSVDVVFKLALVFVQGALPPPGFTSVHNNISWGNPFLVSGIFSTKCWASLVPKYSHVMKIPSKNVKLSCVKYSHFPVWAEFGRVYRTIVIEYRIQLTEEVWSCCSFMRNAYLIKESADPQAVDAVLLFSLIQSLCKSR